MPRTIDPVVTSFGAGDQPGFDLGDQLRLRPFVLGDEPVVQAAFDDPDIRRWHHFRIDVTTEASAWIERTRSNWASGTKADWLIEERGTGTGRVGLHVDAMRGTAEIAYWLLPRGRGRGLTTRSAGAITTWAHELGFHRIVLQHSVRNAASCAVAVRLGFAAEGIARQSHLHDDGWHDMHQHAHVAGDRLL